MGLIGLAVVVALAHAWLVGSVLPDQLGEGDGARAQRMARMDVAFVRDLAPAQPLAAPPPRARPTAAPAPARAASQPDAAEPQVAPPVVAVASAAVAAVAAETPPSTDPPAAPPVVAATDSAADTAADTVATAAAIAPMFEWPPSTRLSYRVSGYFRGPVEGQARVEWLRTGTRYQVHMDLGVGPAFAPLASRRVSSEGEITAQGLYPLRYDEETRALMVKPRRVQVTLATDTVRLANGTELPRPAGVQDSASQFVHLTWLFTTRPELLQPGQSIDIPLALPRRMDVWTYDVLAMETLDTPFGPVPTVHVKPRRQARPGTDLVAEVWFAPSLQYLPVRIQIRQDAETHVDLLIERLPQQAEPGGGARRPER